MDSLKSIALHVFGKVQGVSYRLATQQKAIALGIKGLVRNEEDGSVYIEAEGSDDQLHAFIQWCWRGPQMAHVTDVVQRTIAPRYFKTFDIDV